VALILRSMPSEIIFADEANQRKAQLAMSKQGSELLKRVD